MAGVAGRAGPGWWRTAVIYQVYPRSFQDSDGDGIGDLAGLTSRLDHFVDLGVDAIWLSPVFPSPGKDFGYDVSDYTAIDPVYGTLDDFDRLVCEAHARGLRIIFDWVLNHTSDQHPWFLESRSSRTSPKRDWYVWRDPAPDGGPPNNWTSLFGGPAWTLDETTGQYWCHTFLAAQPDLNWRNPEVVAAMEETLRFWFRRGVDGVRMDALMYLLKDPDFRDNPPNPAWHEGQMGYLRFTEAMTSDQPDIHVLLRGLRRVSDEFTDRVLIGEAYLPLDRLVAYYGADLDEIQIPFNFALILHPWDAATLADLIEDYERLLPAGAWPNWVLGNHDRVRVATRLGAEQARAAMAILLTLRGTPTMYYGDEIGMENVDLPSEYWLDPQGVNQPGTNSGRDGERTPMQWDAGPSAGFTTGRPWLPVATDATRRNVAVERGDPASMLVLTRNLLRLRRDWPALALGAIDVWRIGDDLLAYRRRLAGARDVVVVANFAEAPRMALLPEAGPYDLLLSTRPSRRGGDLTASIELAPLECVLLSPSARD